MGDLPTFKAILKKGFPEIELAGPVFVKETLGIVAWKSHPELMAQVNKALDKMMVDGRYARFYQKWFEEPLTTEIVGELESVKGQGSKVPIAADISAQPVQNSKPISGSSFTFRWDLLKDALPLLLKGAQLTVQLTLCSLLMGITGGLFWPFRGWHGFRD